MADNIDVVLNVFLHRINESYLIWLKQCDLIQLPGLNVSPVLTGLLKAVNKAFRRDQCSISQQRWSANIHTEIVPAAQCFRGLRKALSREGQKAGKKCTYLKLGLGLLINTAGIGKKNL